MSELVWIQKTLNEQTEEMKKFQKWQQDVGQKLEQLSERHAALLRRQHKILQRMESSSEPKKKVRFPAFATSRRNATFAAVSSR
ncbi:MAG: hypothetical protein HQL54_02210 [Magnetococcales bacterium]|nr:hypothetical protein [Magnetococcales bacterium]